MAPRRHCRTKRSRDNAGAQSTYRRLGMADSGYAVYETDWTKHETNKPILPNTRHT